jgi:cell division septal protein FtsQ
MKAYDVKKLSYRDELAKRNRWFFVLKLAGLAVVLILIAGGGAYLVFFTDKLEIKDITITGLNTIEQDVVLAQVGSQTRNIILFDSRELEAGLLSQYPVFKSIRVSKEFPHKLTVDVIERKPAGIWCVIEDCRYFDDEIKTWGPAVKSSGFLLLTVNDERLGEFNIDKEFFDAIRQVAAGLSNPTIRSVSIPEGSFDELRIYTDKSFYIIFSLDSNIKDQLEVLKIFLDERSKDPGFSPQYLDARIDGRIYFR